MGHHADPVRSGYECLFGALHRIAQPNSFPDDVGRDICGFSK
jgi:hypothetical protein